MSHDRLDFAGRIREEGYRLTPQRQIILDALCALGRHVTVAELYDAVRATAPAIDRATVYRTVNFFVELGLVCASVIDGQTVYEIAGDAHHHLVCRTCGRVEHLADYHLHDLLHHLAAEHGFAADLERLTIPGLCRECSRAAAAYKEEGAPNRAGAPD